MPRLARRCTVLLAFAVALPVTPAAAISPQNPYRSFNLSGINYGSMQWERAQRQGRRAWPSSGMPARGSSLTAGGFVGGGGGAVIQGTRSRSAPRTSRRFRR